MARCAVRRVFAIPVTGHPAGIDGAAGPLAEWMPAQERWRTYCDDEVITDPRVFEPVPVRALLDAVEADNAVTQALLDKGNRVLVRHTEAAREEGRKEGEKKGRKEGEKRGVRESSRLIMRTRGIAMDAIAHARIDACCDLEILQRWLARAVQVTRARDLFGDD